MSELFFLLKSLLLTLVIVMLLQIRMGQHTVEEKTIFWARSSSIIEPMQQVADGGLRLFRKIWRNTLGQINSKFLSGMSDSNAPGKRTLGVELKRSANYVKEQAKKAEEYSRPHIKRLKKYSNETAEEAARQLDQKLDDE